MKQLKDLKDEILANNIKKFYVFYGQDFGLRKHYIDKIGTFYDKIKVIDNSNLLAENNTGGGLFVTKTLYIIYNDIEFAKQKSEQIKTFIHRLVDDGVIFDYEEPLLETNLFKEFEDDITNFPNVQDNIAEEFVDSEVSLTQSNKLDLAYNCNNDYGKILLETDKIKQYANFYNTNQEVAYEELNNRGQLLQRYEEYNSDYLMNDILTYNKPMFKYWYKLINEKYKEEFWFSLSRIFNDLQIAYLLKRYNKWNGGNKAYELGLPWGRTKVLRDLNIYYDANFLLYLADNVCSIDEKVKTGSLAQEDAFNYFFCLFV